MELENQVWKKCSSCKNTIPFQATYYKCNVSTCNQKRTGWDFCKVECWDAHVPKMNHRESWAVEEIAPTVARWKQILAEEAAPLTRQRKEVVTPVATPTKTTVIRRPK